MLHILDEQDVRRIVRDELQRPEYVTQRNVEQVIGYPRRDFLRDAREGKFPSTKERRLVVARTADVIEYFELRIRTSKATPANDADAETIALARVGARRVAR